MTEASISLPCIPLSGELLFESSADCVKVLDPEGHLMRMNRNGQCLMEVDDFETVVGLPWADLWPEQTRASIHAEMEKARKGGVGRFFAFCPTAKGTPKYWDVCITPVRATDGTLEGLLSISRDVTPLQRTVDALREAVDELQQVKLKRERAAEFAAGQQKALELAVSDAPIASVLALLTETAESYSDKGILASILLIDDSGEHLRLGAAPSFPPSYNKAIDGMAIGPAAGSCGTAAFTKKPVFVRDIATNPLWATFGEMAISYGLRSCWSQPILSSTGSVLGTFAFYYREERDPTQVEKESMPVLLHTAALVLERHQEAKQRKMAEDALRRSEANHKRFFDSNIIGIVHYRTDGTIRQANDAFLAMLGYTRGEFERTSKSWAELTPPEWWDVNRKVVEQLQATGTVDNFQNEFFRKDGSRAAVYMGAVNHDGCRNEGIAYVLDISELRKSAQAVKDSESKFRTIANAMPQMVWSTLPDGYHDYYNDQWYEFTGVPYGSTDGEAWNGMFHPDDQDRAWVRWRHSLETGETYDIEYRLRHRSGEYRWTLGRALPIRDEAGQIVRWMGTCTDIHEQKLAQEALRDADRRKDEFLAMLAHELRNPLAPICAAADMLRMGTPDTGLVRQLSEIVSRQAWHMTGLIEDLLDVSRVTQGKITLDQTILDVRGIVAEAVEQVRPSVDAHRHRLQVDMPPSGIQVSGDKKRLVQVLANVLNNAVKYTPNGGCITLHTEVRNDQVLLSIKDNGIGMSPELVQRAFELFVQGERTSDRSQGGLGIGLALVRSLVALHGGSVTAHSNGLGTGSEFTIALPLSSAGQKWQGQAHAPVLETAGLYLHILVVDDNIDTAQVLGMLLESHGHIVRIEHHPMKALNCVSEFRPDVCLIDIGLPEIDGNELARRLRRSPEVENAVLMAITGYGQAHDQQAALASGFDHHFVKPVDSAKLFALLAKVSDKRKVSKRGWTEPPL